MSGDPGVLAAVGTVVELAETEYRYGIGLLRLRVERITLLNAEPGWVLVSGRVVDHRGQEWDRRSVVVTVKALRRYM